ncbi:hypothetical protein Rhe02_33530 [Rhizocola hellebori]|uniref:Uncharacterized protein n=1 Tax=Rhizocola hellebori TaxID=1392758 RepID=A0A8J3Q8T6_9ACTN|nr:hypothetical protein Rhe02_33530 [Rhizocola hellebori]
MARAGGVFEDDALVDRVNLALQNMWSRLDSLPRSDEFWSGTNNRTTWYKVDEFAQRCVVRDSSDETARWAAVGFWMHAGSFGGLQLLAEDAAVRDDAVYDLIAVAEWVWLEVGVDPGPHLERALARVGSSVLQRLTQSGGRVGRAAVAASVFLAGESFTEAIGRQHWNMFLHALAVPMPHDRDPSVVREALAAAEEQWLATAQQCLSNDASSVVDLMDAAQWWAVHRDYDVVGRLRELLGALSRDSLELMAGDHDGETAASLRAALLVLDGHGFSSRRYP